MLHRLDEALARHRFAAGPDYSLADGCLAPFIMRLDVLGLSEMWADYPRVTDWWTRMQARPSFRQLLDESFPEHYFSDMRELVGDVWPSVREILVS